MKKLADNLEKSNKESLRHLMTVLYSIFQSADYSQDLAKRAVNKKDVDVMYEDVYKKWEEAEQYLRDYINN